MRNRPSASSSAASAASATDSAPAQHSSQSSSSESEESSHQQPLLSILRSSASSSGLPHASNKSTKFAVTDIKNSNSPFSLSSKNASRRMWARIRGLTMLGILFVAAIGSFYLSHGVVMENMEKLKNDGDLEENIKSSLGQEKSAIIGDEKSEHEKSSSKSEEIKENEGVDKCAFRSYPSNRLYGLNAQNPPKFLTSDAMYIRGQWPFVINPSEKDDKPSGDSVEQTSPVKVCLDTTSWENTLDADDGKHRWPFTDSHNPSVISLAPNPYVNKGDKKQNDSEHSRLDPDYLEPIGKITDSLSGDYTLDSLFLSVSIFGGGQCKFGFTPQQIDQYRFSKYEEPPGGKRAVIALLSPPHSSGSKKSSSHFQTLLQTTLLLERDAKYGTHRRNSLPPKPEGNGFSRMHQEFDDPRLFFYEGKLWVLYRNGPLFGYQDQIHNPIHFEILEGGASTHDGGENDNRPTLVAYVKASETIRVCCGRNIALISEETTGGTTGKDGTVEWVASPKLKALTWVDPVTVVDVKVKETPSKRTRRHLLDSTDGGNSTYASASYSLGVESSNLHSLTPQPPSLTHIRPSFSQFDMAPDLPSHHRRLGSQQELKSNIHGTNGYMVPLPSTGELLGMAHFHRPENRKESEFALHGHHYTHAFFTIARDQTNDENGQDLESKPFKLKRLSNEFVFRSMSSPIGEAQSSLGDADVIQFASGLDLVGSDVDGKIIISYGINDCEGAVFAVTVERVQQMLIEVARGQEVVDLMTKVKV